LHATAWIGDEKKRAIAADRRDGIDQRRGILEILLPGAGRIGACGQSRNPIAQARGLHRGPRGQAEQSHVERRRGRPHERVADQLLGVRGVKHLLGQHGDRAELVRHERHRRVRELLDRNRLPIPDKRGIGRRGDEPGRDDNAVAVEERAFFQKLCAGRCGTERREHIRDDGMDKLGRPAGDVVHGGRRGCLDDVANDAVARPVFRRDRGGRLALMQADGLRRDPSHPRIAARDKRRRLPLKRNRIRIASIARVTLATGRREDLDVHPTFLDWRAPLVPRAPSKYISRWC